MFEINNFDSLEDYSDKEIKIILRNGCLGKIILSFIDHTDGGSPRPLQIEQITQIKSAHPNKINIKSASGSSGPLGFQILARYQAMNYSDLWVNKTDVVSLLEKHTDQDNINNNKYNSKLAALEAKYNSALKCLIIMAVSRYDYDPKALRNVATGEGPRSLKTDSESCAVPIHEDTFRDRLNEASELFPDIKIKIKN